MSDCLEIEPLSQFSKNNMHTRLIYKDSKVIIEKPFGIEDCKLEFDENDENISYINQLILNPKFNAIIFGNKVIEFIFGFVSTTGDDLSDIFSRSFSLMFENTNVICKYDKPSDDFWKFSDSFQRIPTDDNERSLPQMETFQLFKFDGELEEDVKKFFENKMPVNFFVIFPDNIDCDLIELSKHINFVMNYYDRKTPEIVIKFPHDELQKKEIRYISDSFPNAFRIKKIDPVILSFLETATKVNIRNAFIHYYQVLEYAGFYYIEDKVKKSLLRAVRNPSFISDPEKKLSEFFDLMTESIQNEEGRMKRVIEDCANVEEIWKEIEFRKDFFSQNLTFEGGFELKALVDKSTTFNDWKVNWVPKIFDNLTKIRNCLVHAREKRESKVILPTTCNNKLILQYVPLIRRLAEQITFHTIEDQYV